MNNLLWSILVNRVANGEAYAVAQAYVLNMVPPIAQTDADSDMTAAQTAITTFAGLALDARSASWYLSNAPFQDGLGQQNLGPLPSVAGAAGDVLTTDGRLVGWGSQGATIPPQTGQNGKYLTTDGSTLSWATVSASLALGAFGSTPDAKGATFSSGTLTMQPADATHPGAVAAADQDFGTFARTVAGLSINQTMVTGKPALTWDAVNKAAIWFDTGHLNLSPGFGTGFDIKFTDYYGVAWAKINATELDLTGIVGYAIKLKSPDGTVYTATMANGGTWNIV